MSPLPLWREADPEVFRGTIVAAAERLDVLPLAVEKDYWICQTLHSIVTTHPGEVVFKGGTSLEKLGIIRRSSTAADVQRSLTHRRSLLSWANREVRIHTRSTRSPPC